MEVHIYISEEDLNEERRKKYDEVMKEQGENGGKGYLFEVKGEPYEIYFDTSTGELNVSLFFDKSSVHVYIPVEELVKAKLEDLLKILKEKHEALTKAIKSINDACKMLSSSKSNDSQVS